MKLALDLIEAAQGLVLPPQDTLAAQVWSALRPIEQRAVLDSDDPSFAMLRGRSRFDKATGERVETTYQLARPHWLDYPKNMGGQCWGPKPDAESELVNGLSRDEAIRLCYRVKAYGLSQRGVAT